MDYGFTTSDEVPNEVQGLSIGTYHVLAVDEVQGDAPSERNPFPVIVTWKELDSETPNRTSKVWYNVNHSSPQAANIARASVKKIADATGRPVSAMAPIKGRLCKVIVDLQKGSDSFTEIKKYLPADEGFSNAKPQAQPQAQPSSDDAAPF